MNESELLVRVVAPRFVAGFVFDRATGRCTEAAPILRRHFLGKRAEDIRQLARAKGWDVRRVQGRVDPEKGGRGNKGKASETDGFSATRVVGPCTSEGLCERNRRTAQPGNQTFGMEDEVAEGNADGEAGDDGVEAEVHQSCHRPLKRSAASSV